jgi:peptide-methionine (R)-S-oxide reductase
MSHSETPLPKTAPDGKAYRIQLDDGILKNQLDPLAFEVLRQGGTERAFTGEYTDTETEGIYKCRACSAELFRSSEKFHSGCGWPSFYAPSTNDAVLLLEDKSLYPRVRTEVRCASCGSHLGHVFEGEGYDVPTDQRWCINSVSLTLDPKVGASE